TTPLGTRPGPGGDQRMVVRWLSGRARRAPQARRVPRCGSGRARDRLDAVRHALHRALPRRPARSPGGLRAELPAAGRTGTAAFVTDRTRTRGRQRVRGARTATVP